MKNKQNKNKIYPLFNTVHQQFCLIVSRENEILIFFLKK